MNARAARTVGWLALAALVAGACDLAYALAFYGWKGLPPQRLLQSIASGLLGREAFGQGWATAALGLVLHFAILFVAAALFLGAARRWPWLREDAVAAGLLYGLAIYVAMNFVVLPLSAYPFPINFPLLRTATGLLAHMLGVGLPIALVSRRALR